MQHLREHYEAQHTDILLDIAKKDLMNDARIVLNEVLVNRGVALAAHPEPVEGRSG